MNTQTEIPGKAPIPPKEFLGHPISLWQLSNIEMWERFAFYGMRALLAVYVATTFFGHLGDQANSQASLVYGGYTALVYATGIIGGYIADRVLGYQRSILLGAVVMAAGLCVLLIEDLTWFLVGLALIVAGNGLFKPNISTMIGKLYVQGDVRRDSGFTIFYMGINLGAFIAPFITAAWIGATFGMKWGFFAAAIGMILSILFLQIAKKHLGKIGRAPTGREGWGLFFRLNPDVADVVERFGVLAPDNVRLLVMGNTVQPAAGCLCPENTLLAAVANAVSLRRGEVILLDTQAGIEHFGRALAQGFRHAVVVTDPTFNGVQVALQAARLADALGIPAIHLVVNRVRGERDVDRVNEILAGEGVLSFTTQHWLPFEDAFGECEPDVGPLLGASHSSLISAVSELRDTLLEVEAERWQHAS